MVNYKLPKILLLIFLCFINVYAQNSCDDTYDSCIKKCDSLDNPSDTCYGSCDEQYSKCLESEHSIEPEQIKETEELPSEEEK